MKELQKLWANKYVRYGVIVVGLSLVAFFAWKWYQKKKDKEAEPKPGETDTAKVPVPGKDGTMLPATQKEVKPAIYVIKPDTLYGLPAATSAATQGTTVAVRTR